MKSSRKKWLEPRIQHRVSCLYPWESFCPGKRTCEQILRAGVDASKLCEYRSVGIQLMPVLTRDLQVYSLGEVRFGRLIAWAGLR